MDFVFQQLIECFFNAGVFVIHELCRVAECPKAGIGAQLESVKQIKTIDIIFIFFLRSYRYPSALIIFRPDLIQRKTPAQV
jgi:hypothetical protein